MEIARGLLERIITLGTRAIPELQGSSKKAHVEPSSSQNKLWAPKTTSAARKSTVLGRKKGNSARSSGENHYPRNALNPRAPRLIKKRPMWSRAAAKTSCGRPKQLAQHAKARSSAATKGNDTRSSRALQRAQNDRLLRAKEYVF